MADYLTKDEIKMWRSSLEKITLEDFAARLGKVINDEKETRDIVDIVLEKEPVLVREDYRIRTEKIINISQKRVSKDKEITTVHQEYKSNLKSINGVAEKKPVINSTAKAETKKSVIKPEPILAKEKPVKVSKTVAKTLQAANELEKKISKTVVEGVAEITFKKPLTEREQRVFSHFVENKNSIVYAKDLAELLELPKDYVYKYIKTLRNKIIQTDALENADKGGFILNL